MTNSNVSDAEKTLKEGDVQHSVFPLTLFDNIYADQGIVIGWLVEGQINMKKVETALDKVVSEWPMLGGRLEKTSQKPGSYVVRTPTQQDPTKFKAYQTSTRTSQLPISNYISLPLPVASNVLPSSLFMNDKEKVPRSGREWVAMKAPILYWHTTYFNQDEDNYSCIGVTFPHAVLDGLGISLVVHAIESELLGKPWDIPATLASPGICENKMEALVMNGVKDQEEGKRTVVSDYHAGGLVGWWYIITFILWHFWQERWHKTRRRLIIFPKKAYTKLTEGARQAMKVDGKGDAMISTGDVMAAFFFKTIFSDGTAPWKRVHLTSLASLRRFFNGQLNDYPHNCIAPVSYPMFTVSELSSMSVASLAYKFAKARKSFSEEEALEFYKIMKTAMETQKFAIPNDIRADENVTLSNTTIARVVNIDWTGAGGGRTVCRYKTVLNDLGITFTNILTIAGQLDDESLVLDVVLNQRKLAVLEAAVERLIAEA